jgi:hypothetical protein
MIRAMPYLLLTLTSCTLPMHDQASNFPHPILEYQIYGQGTLATLAEPSLQVQSKLLALARSPEVQISAFCHLMNGRVTYCDNLRIVPTSSNLHETAAELLSQFIVEKRLADNTVVMQKSAMFDVRVAKVGTAIGASGHCIVVMCGFPTPPPPRPPSRAST